MYNTEVMTKEENGIPMKLIRSEKSGVQLTPQLITGPQNLTHEGEKLPNNRVYTSTFNRNTPLK